MNSAKPYSPLHIVAKRTDKLSTDRRIHRYIEAEQGILWETVAPIFVRHGWKFQAQTRLFIKAYHEQSKQMVIISKMGRGHVLVNHGGQVYGSSHLHEIENLAEIQTASVQDMIKRPWYSEFVANLRQFIS